MLMLSDWLRLMRSPLFSPRIWESERYMKVALHHLDFSVEELLPLTQLGRKTLERAKRGHPKAIRDLGCEYIWGEQGYPKDENRARHWYTIAADAGDTEAMWDVSGMYLCGQGGAKEIEKGLAYLRTAAVRRRWDLGVELSAQMLADIYQNGWYKQPQDFVEAQKWRDLAKLQYKRYRGWKRKLGIRLSQASVQTSIPHPEVSQGRVIVKATLIYEGKSLLK
jgi:TPR repeat protein